MKENYFVNSNYQNNINIFNQEKRSILSNNTYTNSLSFNRNQTISNSDESLGIEELPPMEEDIDHLKNFNLQNRNKIYHYNNLNYTNNMNPNKHGNRSYSFSVKTNNNNQFLNQANAARKTELIYMNKPYNLNTVFYQNKNDISRENNQGRALKSRYSSASENKYHFMHKLASNPQIIFPKSSPINIKNINLTPIDINNASNNNSDNKYYYNNNEYLYSNKSQSNFSSPQSLNQNVINNNIQNNQASGREKRFKQVSNYGYKTLDTRKLQNNIGLVKVNENKSAQNQNINIYNNKIISGFDLNGNILNNNINNYYQQSNKQKIYNEQRLTNPPIPNNNKTLKEINFENQRNTYYGNNNKYINSYFNIKNTPQETQGKRIVNFNQAIKNVEVQDKEPEIAVVTKITDSSNANESQGNNLFYEQYLGEVNNNINKKALNKKIPLENNNKININFIQNNINNINIKAPNDFVNKKVQDNNIIPEDIDKLINENIKKYITNPSPNAYIPTIQTITNTNKPQQIQSEEDQKIINSYSTTTNTIIKDNKILNSKNSNPLDLFSKPKENHINNNYITNKSETERVTVIDDLIQQSKTPLVNKDVDVTYNDFDGSGFVKNYGGVSRPGKDSSGKRKTNQDALVCLTNINSIKDFNIFGVLDGHGPEGHYVSQFAAEFIPSRIANHPEIKVLKEPEKIYQKLKENNCIIITQAFVAADEQLKNIDFDAIESGSTCCLIIHIGSHIICANSGDSRALVVFDDPRNTNTDNLNYWNVTALSMDYKPEIPEERNRIIMSGGIVEQMKDELGEGCGPYRVWAKGKDYPGLAMSRSIGDLKGKELGVIPDPGILEYDLNESTRFVVACSDGVFEFLDNKTVMNLCKNFFIQNDASAYCHELINYSLLEWEKNDNIVDDITAVVAFF